jgi:2-C-methyl-D-erythritol 4-phosphate cytidylyltransferase / 2-C-methyl-D-erythritol 2,4-cyclodiphosphate synthase
MNENCTLCGKTETRPEYDQAMTTTALIVAAGSGERAGQELPKQYTRFGDKTLLTHTLDKLVHHPLIDQILVVIAKDQEQVFKDSIEDFTGKITWCTGGDTRQKSVFEGLKRLDLSPPDKVLIHDAARPFVSCALIDQIIQMLDNHTAVLPVLGLNDTLKRVDRGRCVETIDRTALFQAQTPQGFDFIKIFNAHKRADREKDFIFTDDASIAEWADIEVSVIEGSSENFKITTAQDIKRAAMLLHPPAPDIRCGEGFDVHKFGPGESLTLCGIDIPFNQSLMGHSDADVALHALTDALLGAIACGDIGSHFPPSDPQWRDQSSDRFLDHACKLVAEKNGTILSIDVTIICEQPKIAPLRDQMRQRIAAITSTDISRISVKATTTEGLGFTGRGEGIAAKASVSVFLGLITPWKQPAQGL